MAGRELSSEASPTAMTHTTPLASSAHPRPCTMVAASGVGVPPASRDVPPTTTPKATAVSGRHSMRAPGTRVANSASRERPVTTRSRNTPVAESPAPASAPISTAVSGPM